MKKTYKIAKKITLFVLVFSFLLISTGVLPNIIPTENPNKIMLSADTWNSDLVEIEYGTTPNEFIYESISKYVILGVEPEEEGLVIGVNNDNYSKIKKNTVFKIENGLDLYYFSELCNPTFSSGDSNDKYTEFLKFNYILGANINYEDASQTFKMLRPIGWKDGHPFEGTFDGQGHTISNIFYRPFESKEEAANYDGLIYLSLFSVNAGTIKNVGIINPNMIQYDHYEGIHYVTPFIGLNKKLVENCYVQDLRGNNAGMSAEGGYTTTMFAAANSAPYMVFDPIDNKDKEIIPTINNCYVAVDRITSHTITMTDKENRYPFIEVNAGTMTHCYYDKEIIATNQIEDKLEEISGLNALNTEDFLDQTKFIYYEESESGIVDQIWFSNSTYEDEYSSYLKLKYPVLRGFETTIFNDEEYFAIKEANDLVLMSEYIDQYQAFRTASYLLVNSVDLNTVSENAFIFTDAVFSGKLIGTTNNSDGYSVELADGTTSNHTSIFNLKINKGNSYNGYRAYGLFSVLSGTVENINLVDVTINESDITENNLNLSEINTLGAVCGLLEGGTINNVNIKVDITLDNGTSTFLGTQQVGGITGTVLDGTISNSTTTGVLKSTTYDNPGTLTKKDSHSIGGIVGKVESCDAIANCLNNIKINNINYSDDPGTAVRQYIGGVIGSGNISNTYELQNNMFINVNNVDNVFEEDQHNCYYSIVYVGGVIGRVNNATLSNGVYLNNADINYDVNDNNHKAYISGVMNVISDVADDYDTFNLESTPVQSEIDKAGNFKFTSLSNAGLLNITNGLELDNGKHWFPEKYSLFTTVENGLDIRAAGICYSYLTKMEVEGGYNLKEYYKRNGSDIDKVLNNPQEIDMSLMDEYAPAFNADNKVYYLNNRLHIDTNHIKTDNTTIDFDTPYVETTVKLERVYNYNNINYITRNTVNMFILQLSGCINGINFNLKNIRNDGNIKVYFSNATHENLKLETTPYRTYYNDYKKIKIYGVFEEVSLGHHAEDIYNGGNITISQADGIVPNFTLYAAGICYKNVGTDQSKSSGSLLMDRGYIGSLHNCVNNGNIRLTRGDITNLPKDDEGNEIEITEPGRFYGGVRLTGITSVNSTTISQTFNLGDVYNINEVFDHYSGGGWNPQPTEEQDIYGNFSGAAPTLEVESAGFCYVMQNERYNTDGDRTKAAIIDSANNGTIIAMNTGTDESFTNAAGFIARNDRGEDGILVNDNSVSQNSHTIKIEYSINYGDIYAYNTYEDIMFNTNGEQQSKAAGFVCLGACTIIDTINYGNIYGNSVAAGMFGFLYISRMRAGGLSGESLIHIANSINYGNAKILEINDDNVKLICNVGKTKEIPKTKAVTNETVNNSANGTRYYVAGALIGSWANGNNDTGDNSDLAAMKVQNLVNFNDELNLLGCTFGQSYNNQNEEKRSMLEHMATTNPHDTSPSPFDTNLDAKYGIKSYSKDTKAGNPSVTNIFSQEFNGGIFNENYTLRTAPELVDEYDNIVTDPNNANPNNTDNFIADYIQFVPYSKVNEYLIEKIGLKEVVEENAYTNALTNVELIKQVLIFKNHGLISDVYNEILEENKSLVESKRNMISDAIVEYLQENPDKAADIAKILVEDEAAVKQILTASEIQTIITKLLHALSEDEINNLLISAINTYGLNGFVNDDANLVLIGNIINKFANQDSITNPEKELIINIFNTLVQNDACVEAYVDSLTNEEKETLANNIYKLVKDNPEIIEVIADTYFDSLVIDNNTDLTTLKNAIIQDRIPRDSMLPNYPIEDQEYIDMYTELMLPTMYDITDVQKAINDLTSNELDTLLTNMNKQVNGSTTSDMYKYLESGRTNTSGIYLLATEYNYVAIINSSNYTFVSSTGTTSTGQVYSGNINGIGNTVNDKVEMFIESNACYEDVTFTNGRRSASGYVYWRYADNQFSTYSSTSENNSYYKVSLSLGSTLTSDFITDTNVNTGVFATPSDSVEISIRSGMRTYYVDSYNFSDLEYYKYIDYGTGATAKNNGNLTHEMLNKMIYEAGTNNNDSYIKNYLYSLYVNSNGNRAPFLKLLFPDASSDVDINTALTYLNNNITTANVSAVLNNISSKTAQGNIIKLLNQNDSYYVNILKDMLQKLDSANEYDNIKTIVGDIFTNGYGSYNDSTTNIVSYITNMIYNNDDIWDGLTFEEKLGILSYLFNTTDLGIDLLVDAVNNNKLTATEYTRVVKQLLIADIYNLYEYRESLSAHLDADIMAEISAIIISGNTSLFTKYTELTQLGIIEELEDMKIDSSIITDFTGIYALASSQGIKAGLFLPDNINLIQIDEYEIIDGKKVNDPTWRGGSASYPNTYYKVDEKTGELIVDSNGELIPNVGSVNYKVYYEMKQLKLSIATTIFKMELTDEDNEFVLDNNLEVDYACNEKIIVDGVPELDENGNHKVINEVTFYVPVNHDILKKQKLLINMDSNTYELSYGAKFDVISNKFEINLDGTYEVKDVLTDTFVVQAEDENVKTIYTLNVIITPPAYLDEEVSVEVDGVESIIVKDRKELQSLNHEFVTNIIANTPVSGYNGKIKISYTTKNMMNGLSLLSNLNIYKTQLNTLPNDLTMIDFEQYKETLLVKDKDYVFNKEEHNGIVQIEDEKYTGFDPTTNGYKDGEVFFNISLSNYQSKGIYLVEIVINKDAKYYVFFKKAASSENSLSSLIFNGNEFLNNSSLNNNNTIDDISKIEYGTPLTEEFFNSDKAYIQNSVFESISGLLNPNYFANYESNICIYDKESFNINAPNGTFIIGLKQNTSGDNYYVSEMFDVNTFNNNNNWDYLITIPNDSDKKSVFNNVKLDDLAEVILVDDIVTVNFIEENYLDGIITSPLSTFKIGNVSVSSAVNEQGIKLYTYAVQIIITAEDGSTNTFIHYITEEVYESEIDKVFINGGVDSFEQDPNITYSYVGSFEKNEMPTYRFDYMLDKFYINNDKSYFDVQFYDKNGEVMEVPYGVYVNVTDGLGFNVEFSSDALSQDYYFALVYKNMVEFRTGETNNWNVTFDVINIKKEKNRDSYLDNISFFSESVTASIRTIITSDSILELENHDKLNLDVYEGYLTNPFRKIACLPDKIYYNDFEWSLSYDENGNPKIEKKEKGFYVVGLVNKTQLDYYTPDFTLPEDATIYRTKEIDGVIYRYVPYFVDNELVLTNFLISEDGSILRDSIEKEHNIISLPAGATDYSQFIWDDPSDDESDDKGEQLYKISSVAGYQTIVIDGQTIENTSLRTDFNSFGSYDKELDVFNYVNYRVYSEMYSENASSSYYTDYYVTAQDLTNNIKFDIEIEYSGKLYEEVSNVFVELVCHALKEGITDTDSEDINDYTLYNKAGIFSYFNDKNELEHEDLRTNVSGFYSLYVSVPDGYKVSLVVFDDLNPNKEDSGVDQGREYLMNQEFLVRSHIVAREIKIIVTITEIENYTPDWGVHVQENSNKIQN